MKFGALTFTLSLALSLTLIRTLTLTLTLTLTFSLTLSHTHVGTSPLRQARERGAREGEVVGVNVPTLRVIPPATYGGVGHSHTDCAESGRPAPERTENHFNGSTR